MPFLKLTKKAQESLFYLYLNLKYTIIKASIPVMVLAIIIAKLPSKTP